MQNIFISSGGNLLAHWEAAFTNAGACTLLSADDLEHAKSTDTIVWLHHEHASSDVSTAIKAILDIQPMLKLVVLSNAPDQQEAFQAMSAGAYGYCHAYSAAELLTEVRAVIARGGIWLGRDLLQQLIRASAALVSNQQTQVDAALEKLTRREREVAVEAAKGLSNKEIARVLDITERTVKAHISACLERLNVKDRLQLALILNNKSTHQIN